MSSWRFERNDEVVSTVAVIFASRKNNNFVGRTYNAISMPITYAGLLPSVGHTKKPLVNYRRHNAHKNSHHALKINTFSVYVKKYISIQAEYSYWIQFHLNITRLVGFSYIFSNKCLSNHVEFVERTYYIVKPVVFFSNSRSHRFVYRQCYVSMSYAYAFNTKIQIYSNLISTNSTTIHIDSCLKRLKHVRLKDQA